jgi:hypothetical protein
MHNERGIALEHKDSKGRWWAETVGVVSKPTKMPFAGSIDISQELKAAV